MGEQTRIEAGRKRAKAAKRTVTFTAGAAFVTALALVRLGHPAAASGTSSHRVSHPHRTVSHSDDGERGSMFGGGSIAPSSSSRPPVATSTS